MTGSGNRVGVYTAGFSAALFSAPPAVVAGSQVGARALYVPSCKATKHLLLEILIKQKLFLCLKAEYISYFLNYGTYMIPIM